MSMAVDLTGSHYASVQMRHYFGNVSEGVNNLCSETLLYEFTRSPGYASISGRIEYALRLLSGGQ